MNDTERKLQVQQLRRQLKIMARQLQAELELNRAMNRLCLAERQPETVVAAVHKALAKRKKAYSIKAA